MKLPLQKEIFIKLHKFLDKIMTISIKYIIGEMLYILPLTVFVFISITPLIFIIIFIFRYSICLLHGAFFMEAYFPVFL